jgi:pyoverdine/dityrosine biosynthesis protein Dit1
MSNIDLSLFKEPTSSIWDSITEIDIESANLKIAQRVLGEVMNYRRTVKSNELCTNASCSKCGSAHLARIIKSIENNEPVSFVLPAFPGKSPNSEKVLGVLPDHAERLSLIFLGTLCEKVKEYYAPGMKIIICSDGRVFSDVVGMKEENVTAYQIAIDELINDLALEDISTFNLDDIYKGSEFDKVRTDLMDKFGDSMELLKEKIRKGKSEEAKTEEVEANRMYRGITRFLFEDSLHPDQTKSRSALQRDARENAYEVIRRSNAWSKLIAIYFSGAVRLSIHPQACGSSKLGIRLIGNESWMTPWHGVAVETEEGMKLLKKSDALKLGAEVICDSSGIPSHFKLPTETYALAKKEEAYV